MRWGSPFLITFNGHVARHDKCCQEAISTSHSSWSMRIQTDRMRKPKLIVSRPYFQMKNHTETDPKSVLQSFSRFTWWKKKKKKMLWTMGWSIKSSLFCRSLFFGYAFNMRYNRSVILSISFNRIVQRRRMPSICPHKLIFIIWKWWAAPHFMGHVELFYSIALKHLRLNIQLCHHFKCERKSY